MTKDLNTIIAEIEAKATTKALERRVALLSTDTGANRMLRQKDGAVLARVVGKIADITEKPVFTGYTYSSNVETIVAIASALQYMKGDLRESIPEAVWTVFDADTRSDLINAYGNLPYLAENLAIEIKGESVVIDPEARTRAKTGLKANVSDLEVLVNTVAMNLNLLAEYNCTQLEADKSWSDANRKIAKAEVLESYKDSL